MIHVIASIHVRQGCLDDYLGHFRDNLQNVRAEDGCIRYEPCLDAGTGWKVQTLDPQCVTVVETWESMDALEAHSQAPHMVAFRERAGHLVDSISLRVVHPV